jgi:hypothetical protein
MYEHEVKLILRTWKTQSLEALEDKIIDAIAGTKSYPGIDDLCGWDVKVQFVNGPIELRGPNEITEKV